MGVTKKEKTAAEVFEGHVVNPMLADVKDELFSHTMAEVADLMTSAIQCTKAEYKNQKVNEIVSSTQRKYTGLITYFIDKYMPRTKWFSNYDVTVVDPQDGSVHDYTIDLMIETSQHRKLAIEIDGAVHANPNAVRHDEEKNRILQAAGYKVMRITTQPEVIANADIVLKTKPAPSKEDLLKCYKKLSKIFYKKIDLKNDFNEYKHSLGYYFNGNNKAYCYLNKPEIEVLKGLLTGWVPDMDLAIVNPTTQKQEKVSEKVKDAVLQHRKDLLTEGLEEKEIETKTVNGTGRISEEDEKAIFEICRKVYESEEEITHLESTVIEFVNYLKLDKKFRKYA